jgi:hypothetical protein
MITFDTARVQYSSYRIFIALDSDEILVPDHTTKYYKNFIKKYKESSWMKSFANPVNGLFDKKLSTREIYPPVGFKAFITKTLSRDELKHTEELMLFRSAVAAKTGSGLIHPKNISADGDMVALTSACLHAGKMT